MKDSRYKEIMDGLGMPNSRSLLSALQQVENEVAQEVHKSYEKNNKKLNTGAYKCERCKDTGEVPAPNGFAICGCSAG